MCVQINNHTVACGDQPILLVPADRIPLFQQGAAAIKNIKGDTLSFSQELIPQIAIDGILLGIGARLHVKSDIPAAVKSRVIPISTRDLLHAGR